MKPEPEKEAKSEVESLAETFTYLHRCFWWGAVGFIPFWAVDGFIFGHTTISFTQCVTYAICSWGLAMIAARLSRVMREVHIRLVASQVMLSLAQEDLAELKAKNP